MKVHFVLLILIFQGYLPTEEILEKYELLPMWHIANAVRRGRIDELVRTINEYRTLLAKFHIYTVVEKLKVITYRNMFKKMWVFFTLGRRNS